MKKVIRLTESDLIKLVIRIISEDELETEVEITSKQYFSLIKEQRKIWTDDELKREASKYSTKGDFKNSNPQVYSVAYRKGKEFFDDITKHMTYKLKWDENSLRQEALKYDKLSDFRKNNPSAYNTASNRGEDFMRDITSHMVRRILHQWTDEDLVQDALKYNDLGSYNKHSTGSSAARKRGRDFFKKITKHMTSEHTVYSDDELKIEALKYKSRSEFSQKNSKAYGQALRRGKDFFESIVQHMGDIGDLKKRMIYAFVFPNKIVYIGLTYKFEVRKKQHLQIDDEKKKSAVKTYILETGIQPKVIKLTDYLDYQEAQKKEDEFIKKFSDMGYTLLNSQKGGGLGAGIVKWTDEMLRKEASKYSRRVDFRRNSPSAYQIAKIRGLLPELEQGMEKLRDKYTDEELIRIAKQFSSHKDFREQNNPAYQAAFRKAKKNPNFYNDVFSHLEKKKTVWDRNKIFSILPNYTSYQDFYKNKKDTAYNAAKKLNLLGDIKKYYEYSNQ